MISRRKFLGGTAALALITTQAQSQAAQLITPMLSADSFGLSPNSTADQTATLQTAINAAAARNLPLFIPSGRYVVQNIQLPAGTSLIGAPTAPTLLSPTSSPVLAAQDVNDIHLASLHLSGPGGKSPDSYSGLLHLVNCHMLALEDCAFSNAPANGIFMENCAGHITQCALTGINLAAISAQNSAGLRIVNNDITNCGNLGIYISRDETGFDGTLISQNRISNINWLEGGDGQNGNAINGFRADNLVISQNTISDCAFSAVRLNTTRDCQIIGNNCTNLQEVAIFSEFDFSGSIVANNIINQAAAGIAITNFNDGGRLAVCANNIVRNIWKSSPTNPDTTPVGIGVEADTTVSGNVVDTVPGIGISLGWGPFMRNVNASANVLRGCDIGIGVSVVDGVGAASITNNLISGGKGPAIAGMQWNDVTADLSTQPTSTALLNISGNQISG
ncbi:MAG: TIGR03808 family TAT-translocated repetitive protein [Rhodobacteraceae bacterium]|nr:TIGR03808 family TAT-translocated repetitive protein [Paracoccaceae bacterium]